MFKIMSVNAGSSSLKFKLLEMPEEEVITEGIFEKIGLDDPHFKIKYNGQKEEFDVNIQNHQEAVEMLLNILIEKKIVSKLEDISGVGHRILHCGEHFNDSVLMTKESIEKVASVNDLGPLHNPANLMGVNAFMQVLPGVPNVGVFDTSFHLTMDKEAYMYAVPYEWYEKYGIRKYGFHGTSHKFVSQEAAAFLGKPIEELRLITCHMGNGVSLAAVKYGKCVDTTMGLTPLDGTPMGTRSGTIDPAIVDFICRKEGKTSEEVNTILNKKSGYLGISGVSSDSRDLRAVQHENPRADLVLRMQEKKVADYIGSYFVYMGGADAIIFTAGIGENSPETRENICLRLKEALGVDIDTTLNQVRGENALISTPQSKIKVLVIPTNEELMIARDVMRIGNIK
ncbi:MAG: acetate kinase [Prevotella sp.]|nr:acetate kinase [Staphylococcus sp.]MCM1351069.1 acetate kinase [Prevotella sp.]